MKLAYIFPGQGSQSLGMLQDLAARYSIVQETFQELSDTLGFDSWALAQNGPEDKLNLTEVTQPLLLAAGIAVFRVWLSQTSSLSALCFAGHSLGEYTALVAAGALSFGDAAKLVALRGRLMQAAVPLGEGAMAAILGLEDSIVAELCLEAAHGEIVTPANYNSPGQVVIAGKKTAVLRAIELAKNRGAKRTLLLQVSVPSHCALMEPAAEDLQAALQTIAFKAPSSPVIHNVHAQSVEKPEFIQAALVQQLSKPVLWTACVQQMAALGADLFVECGPGGVLSGLHRRILRDSPCLPLGDVENLTQALSRLYE